MVFVRTLALASLVLSSPAAFPALASEAGRPLVAVYPPNTYDGGNQIWSFAQTDDGLLFFGSRDALHIFDGARWDSVPLAISNIRALAPTPDGRIYAGGGDALGYLERDAQGKWAFHDLTAHLPDDHQPPGGMREARVFRGGVYFISSRAVHRWEAGKMRTWNFGPPAWQWAEVLDGELYFFRQGRGLMRLRGDDFELVSDAPEIVATTRLNLFRLPDGGLGYALGNGHVVRVERDRVTPVTTEADDLLRRGGINIGRRLHDGTLVLATDHDGVVHLAPDGRVLGFTDVTLGLENQSVLSIGQDREGNVWLCTNAGIARVEFGRPYTVFDRYNGLGRDSVESMARFAGTIWAGAWDGLYRLQPGDANAGRPARFARLDAVGAAVWALLVFRDQLLVATSRGLLAVGSDGAVTSVLEATEDVLSLAASRRDPSLAYVGRAKGLGRMRFADGAWHDLGLVPGIESNVRTIEEDAAGDVWVGTRNRGVFRVSRSQPHADPSVKQFPIRGGGMADREFSAVYQAHGRLWFYLDEIGIHRFDPVHQQFELETDWRIEGKWTPNILWLTAGADDTVWAWSWTTERDRPQGARRVLTRFAPTPRGWESKPLPRRIASVADGPRVLFFEPNKHGGVLWANGTGGTLRLDLSRPLDAPGELPVVLRRVHGPSGVDFSPAVADPEHRLPNVRERLIFEFGSPTFLHGNIVRYRTRLLGYDDRWSPWQTEPTISFTNLEGGPFTLEVQARDTDDRHSAPGRVTFFVAPPWHRTGWAYSAYVLLALGSVAGFVRWRLGRAERERRRLEKIVAQRTEELRLAKDAADQANRAKSAFLANMSHELRTPLNGVIGYAQILQKSPRMAPEDRERVRIVQTSGEHLLRMINEVLDFSKIEAGRMELSTTAFHLPQLLRDIAAAISARVEQKQLEFIFAPAPGLPEMVLGDPLKLRQVIDNLLGNAVKFTREGSVRFEVRVDGDEFVRFSVRDTGVGISAADRARLFQPFQQAIDGRPPEPGTGLGLAISQRLVDLMGGRLKVDSTPGVGSTFSFSVRLPVLATEGGGETSSGRITGYHGRRRRVLVVDDVAINRNVLRELLAPIGFEITEAASGADALAIVPQIQPDLVLLDLRMPGMDGFELARRLRTGHRAAQAAGGALRPDLQANVMRSGHKAPPTVLAGVAPKLIAMSASVLSFRRDDAFAAGCDDFLPKPFREDDLLARIGLALQLEWIREANTGDPEKPIESVTLLSPVVVEELLAHARRGEIAALRRRLHELRGDPLIDALEAFAKSYRMEQIRALLERHASSHFPS